MAKDLYGILGVSKGVSPEELKRAYRNLSKEWHPDKHKGDKAAEDKFKAINEAYETLSDPKKKQMYDQFGSTSSNGGQGQQGGFDFSGFNNANFSGFGNVGDLFENFFGGAGTGRASDPTVGSDIEVEVTVPFSDIVTGAKKEIELKRYRACETCNGDGAEPHSKIVQCSTCGGTGQVTKTVNSFFGRIQQRGICSVCAGRGTVPEKPCHTCKGEGRTSLRERVTINIPAGISNGQALRISGQGNAGQRGSQAGDLFVHIRVQSDPRFERDNSDIRTSVSVDALTAILGGTVDVDTVHGVSTLTISEGTQPGQILRIKGKGLPELGSSRMGDHYVTVVVEIPKKLSKAERRILEEWREARGD